MKVPIADFLAGISEQKVYYFVSEKISSEFPHHFICIKRTDDDILILSCCTSQFETVKRFVESRNQPYETLVYITPEDENPFTKQTYVNCNQPFTYTVEEFKAMYESDVVNLSGEISDSHYEQILIGIHKSNLVDGELKDLVPKPQTEIK